MEDSDRLLSEREIIKLAEERLGIGAIKVKELLRDCHTVEATPIQFTGEDK